MILWGLVFLWNLRLPPSFTVTWMGATSLRSIEAGIRNTVRNGFSSAFLPDIKLQVLNVNLFPDLRSGPSCGFSSWRLCPSPWPVLWGSAAARVQVWAPGWWCWPGWRADWVWPGACRCSPCAVELLGGFPENRAVLCRVEEVRSECLRSRCFPWMTSTSNTSEGKKINMQFKPILIFFHIWICLCVMFPH